jgi:Family of unknown function (DUF6370)
MKVLSNLVLGLGLVAFLGLTALAADKDDKKDDAKEVTLKGTIMCGKCKLKMTDDCSNVLQVIEKKDGKDVEVNYFIKDEGKAEKYHGKICTDTKKGSVTGVVSEKDGKKWITPSKDGVKFD